MVGGFLRIVIFANGELIPPVDIRTDDLLIAADRGRAFDDTAAVHYECLGNLLRLDDNTALGRDRAINFGG